MPILRLYGSVDRSEQMQTMRNRSTHEQSGFNTFCQPHTNTFWLPRSNSPMNLSRLRRNRPSDFAKRSSVGVEAILLVLSAVVCAFNWVIASVIFVAFVIYCVWRLSTKKSQCRVCGDGHVIPSNSTAGRELMNRYHQNPLS